MVIFAILGRFVTENEQCKTVWGSTTRIAESWMGDMVGWNTGSMSQPAPGCQRYHQSAGCQILFPHLRHARYGDVFHFVRQALAAVSGQQGNLGWHRGNLKNVDLPLGWTGDLGHKKKWEKKLDLWAFGAGIPQVLDDMRPWELIVGKIERTSEYLRVSQQIGWENVESRWSMSKKDRRIRRHREASIWMITSCLWPNQVRNRWKIVTWHQYQ